MQTTLSLPAVLEEIERLPGAWHGCGSLSPRVLAALARHAAGRPLRCSAETGAGKSTLLLSHVSERHLVFALDLGGSVSQVRASPLLRSERVEFIEGPTQQTLPRTPLPHPLDLVLIDGPHAYPFPDLEYYYLYPRLTSGALLILDDIDIPTVRNLFRVLKADAMFSLLDVVHTTAFFERTDAPTFDPLGDGWWEQGFNRSKAREMEWARRVNRWLPASLLRALRRARGRAE